MQKRGHFFLSALLPPASRYLRKLRHRALVVKQDITRYLLGLRSRKRLVQSSKPRPCGRGANHSPTRGDMQMTNTCPNPVITQLICQTVRPPRLRCMFIPASGMQAVRDSALKAMRFNFGRYTIT